MEYCMEDLWNASGYGGNSRYISSLQTSGTWNESVPRPSTRVARSYTLYTRSPPTAVVDSNDDFVARHRGDVGLRLAERATQKIVW